jgi:acyl carrier protein
MHDKASVEDRLRKVLVEVLGVTSEKVTRDTDLADDLGADSLDAIEVIMECEEVFGVEIADAQAQDIKTVGDLIDLLEQGGKNRPAAAARG